MIKDTSLDAFDDILKSSQLQNQQRLILSKMQPNTVYTRRELAHLAGIETSTASARINAMLDLQIVIVGKKKDAFTGRNVEALMLNLEKVEKRTAISKKTRFEVFVSDIMQEVISHG